MSGDTAGRYTRGNAADDGWRLTCAFVTGASQPGQAWTEEQLWLALVLRPTAGGKWLRRLMARKGEGAARQALRRAMTRARRLVAANPTYGGRADAAAELAEVRELVEAHRWPSRTGSTNQKVVLAQLGAAERAGGREYTLSQRQIAELAGCAQSTVQKALDRLGDLWWEVVEAGGAAKGRGSADADQATVWRIRRPEEIRERLAAEAPSDHTSNVSDHPPLRGGHQQVRGAPNTRALASIMAHDAMHEYAHGATGARILTMLDTTEGMSANDLAAALGYHPATMRHRLAKLAADGLVTHAEGLYYRPAEIAPEQLDQAAETRGTTGRGARRVWRHAEQRARRREYLTWLAKRRASRPRADCPPDRLVPLEAYDPETGEILPAHAHNWTGWDVSDPYRPVWRGTQAIWRRTHHPDEVTSGGRGQAVA